MLAGVHVLLMIDDEAVDRATLMSETADVPPHRRVGRTELSPRRVASLELDFVRLFDTHLCVGEMNRINADARSPAFATSISLALVSPSMPDAGPSAKV